MVFRVAVDQRVGDHLLKDAARGRISFELRIEVGMADLLAVDGDDAAASTTASSQGDGQYGTGKAGDEPLGFGHSTLRERQKKYRSRIRAISQRSCFRRGKKGTLVKSRPVLVRLSGDLDIAVREELRAQLNDAAERSTALDLDLSAVEYADSTALGLFIALHKRLKAQGGQVQLVAPSPQIRKLLGYAGLDQIFPILDTAPED